MDEDQVPPGGISWRQPDWDTGSWLGDGWPGVAVGFIFGMAFMALVASWAARCA